MSHRAIENRMDTLLAMLSDLPPTPLAPSTSEPHLSSLFETLQVSERASERAEAEEIIWALWCGHEEQSAAKAMQHAIGALSRRELDEAGRILDELVTQYPRWAEAWNKRATLRFLVDEDYGSLDDIERTLALEPRHFGALCGLGQLCLKNDSELAALMAFQVAVRVNPNLKEIKQAVEALQAQLSRTIH